MFDMEMVACFCEEATDLLTKWESICLSLEKDPSPELFNDLFRVAHNLKGSSRSVGLECFGTFVHQIEDGIALLKQGQAKLTPQVVLMLLKTQGMLQKWIDAAKSDPTLTLPFDDFIAAYQTALKGGSVAEISPAAEATPAMPVSAPVATPAITTPAIAAPPAAAPPPAAVKTQPKLTSAGEETVRVAAKKLDQILEMVGELSIHQSIIWHSRNEMGQSSAALSHAVYLSKKLIKELYERTLGLRMVPIQPIFQRLERSIKEIALTIGKEVEIETIGGEVELDKTVCEKIVEPLTHMVRNSVDHGIESPDARQESGKPRQGKIILSAIQESGSVLIRIEDDGRGLNEEKILAKAKSSAIWDGKAPLNKSEIFALIFLPGFSTAEKVTDVSGRGVGMDVVMRTIESLSGQIQIGSEPGKGTRFSIALPTSLSIIDALIATVDGVDYAVPVSAIEEIIQIADWGGEPDTRLLRVRDRVFPIEKLRTQLPNQTQTVSAPGPGLAGLLVRSGSKSVILAADQVSDPQQIVVRKLASGLASAYGISGGTILANGKPGLILDIPAIAQSYFKKFSHEENQHERTQCA